MASAAVVVSSSGCGSGEGQRKTIVLYGFSIMEDSMKEDIIPAFQKSWRARTGEDVQVITSFAGSGTVTNLIKFGAPAQVAMLATELDALSLREAGLITTNWSDLRNGGTYAYSVASIVTRKGNPKDLRSFEDLTREGVEVMYPDPTTSGGAQWAILALYGSALKTTETTEGIASRSRARELLLGVSANAGSLPESARRALTQFGLGFGDALITYENEVLRDIEKGKDYEIIIPDSTIYIEPKVVIVDRNVHERDREVVRAFVDFLWTHEAQEALARHNLRVWDEDVVAAYGDKYQRVELPFTVEYLGGWEEATSTIINEIWTNIQREIR